MMSVFMVTMTTVSEALIIVMSLFMVTSIATVGATIVVMSMCMVTTIATAGGALIIMVLLLGHVRSCEAQKEDQFPDAPPVKRSFTTDK